jgi:predicted dehydrogenase
MATDKVRCAVIGAGWWATTAHIPALKNNPDAELVAVQSLTLEAAQKVAKDFDVPHACVTVEEVLAIDGLDAVIISSTPNVHYAQTKPVLERGLHVLLEKPMTLTLKEAAELVAIAESMNVYFLISCPWHYTGTGSRPAS